MTQIQNDIPTFADEAEELEFVIKDLDAKHQLGDDITHPFTGLLIKDGQYEAMLARLKELKPDSVIFDGTQPSDVDASAKKIKHNPPLTSITKANGTWDEKVARLTKFFETCAIELGYVLPQNLGQDDDDSGLFVLEKKIDGASLATYWEPDPFDRKIVLARAGIRPKLGVEGADITINAQQIANLPKELPIPNMSVSIRGEIYISQANFERVNAALYEAGKIKEPFANPRNYVAGSIRLEDPKEAIERELSFQCHGMYNLSVPKDSTLKIPTTQMEKAELAASWGFETVEVLPFRWSYVKECEQNQPPGTDGLVIKVNNIDDYEQMSNEGGDPTKAPRGALAWKFPDEEVEIRVENIVWQVARTGELTPVGFWEKPARLADTNVRRCTLHSLGYMRKKQIKLGCRGMIKKSGMIIPDFIRVTGEGGDPEHPSSCPSCNHPTSVEKGGKDADGDYSYSVICSNLYCPAQVSNTLVHYLQTFGCKGVGGSQVRKLYDAGVLKTPVDFYRMDIPTLVKGGLSERQSMLALGAIHMIDKASKKSDEDLARLLGQAMSAKKKIPVWQLFSSFGIYHAGPNAGKNLQAHFGTFETIIVASYDDLIKVSGIGPITGKSIRDFFDDQGDMIKDILSYVEPIGPKTGKLSGKTFCFSGTFEPNKEYWEKKIEDQGGRTTGSVSKTMAKINEKGEPLGYLVEGPNAGSKVKTAQERGVKIITVEALQKML